MKKIFYTGLLLLAIVQFCAAQVTYDYSTVKPLIWILKRLIHGIYIMLRVLGLSLVTTVVGLIVIIF